MHRYHPDPERDDPEQAIVWDDCDRCDEMVSDPRTLDYGNLANAYTRAQGDNWAGTKNEYRLFHTLYMVFVLNERLADMRLLPEAQHYVVMSRASEDDPWEVGLP